MFEQHLLQRRIWKILNLGKKYWGMLKLSIRLWWQLNSELFKFHFFFSLCCCCCCWNVSLCLSLSICCLSVSFSIFIPYLHKRQHLGVPCCGKLIKQADSTSSSRVFVVFSQSLKQLSGHFCFVLLCRADLLALPLTTSVSSG